MAHKNHSRPTPGQTAALAAEPFGARQPSLGNAAASKSHPRHDVHGEGPSPRSSSSPPQPRQPVPDDGAATTHTAAREGEAGGPARTPRAAAIPHASGDRRRADDTSPGHPPGPARRGEAEKTRSWGEEGRVGGRWHRQTVQPPHRCRGTAPLPRTGHASHRDARAAPPLTGAAATSPPPQRVASPSGGTRRGGPHQQPPPQPQQQRSLEASQTPPPPPLRGGQ